MSQNAAAPLSGSKLTETHGWIVVVDEHTGNFNVHGPGGDLAPWERAAEAANASGRRIRCIFDDGTRDTAVAQAKHQFGGEELLDEEILGLNP